MTPPKSPKRNWLSVVARQQTGSRKLEISQEAGPCLGGWNLTKNRKKPTQLQNHSLSTTIPNFLCSSGLLPFVVTFLPRRAQTNDFDTRGVWTNVLEVLNYVHVCTRRYHYFLRHYIYLSTWLFYPFLREYGFCGVCRTYNHQTKNQRGAFIQGHSWLVN